MEEIPRCREGARCAFPHGTPGAALFTTARIAVSFFWRKAAACGAAVLLI
ncbi:MAG: hypothetical protein ACI4WZ_02600 [Eubacteriales bacterium]